MAEAATNSPVPMAATNGMTPGPSSARSSSMIKANPDGVAEQLTAGVDNLSMGEFAGKGDRGSEAYEKVIDEDELIDYE